MKILLTLFLILTMLAHAASDDRTVKLLGQESARLKPIVGTLLTQQQRASASCSQLTALQAQELWVIQNPLFDLNGKPTAGQWQVRYTATLCGEARERNVLFTAKPNGTTAAESLQPGSTLASPQLAADVWKSFQAAAAKIIPNCTNMSVKETSITEAPKTPTALWRELWVARVCQQDVAQIVSFYPTKKGETFFSMAVPRSPMPTPSIQ